MPPLLLRRRSSHHNYHMAAVAISVLAISCLLPSSQEQHYSSVSAFTPNRLLRKLTFDPKKNKFFAVEHVLPPLEEDAVGPLLMTHKYDSRNSTEGSSSSTAGTTTTSLTLPYSSQQRTIITNKQEHYGGCGSDAPLHVLYTNDPKMVNQWLMENVPMEGCAIGFDTEVCTVVLLLNGMCDDVLVLHLYDCWIPQRRERQSSTSSNDDTD